MKTLHALVLLLGLCCCAAFADQTNALPTEITVSGVSYSNVTSGTVTPATASASPQTWTLRRKCDCNCSTSTARRSPP
jgi:hypothetical protein